MNLLVTNIDKCKRCDDNLDCVDYSDEYVCTVVEIESDNRSGDPPKIPNAINFITSLGTLVSNCSLDLEY